MYLGSLTSSSSGYSVASLLSHPPTSYFHPLLSKAPSHQQSEFSKENTKSKQFMLPDATKDLLHFTTIKNLKVPCGSPSFKNKNKNASNSPIPFPSMTKLSELCTMFFTFLPFTIQFNAIQPVSPLHRKCSWLFLFTDQTRQKSSK